MRPRDDFFVVSEALAEARRRLLEARAPQGHWAGRLSSSALATATACFALAKVDPQAHQPSVRRGLDWLAAHQNSNGGWGDTPRSLSNISTTLLAWSALSLARADDGDLLRAAGKAEAWIMSLCGSLQPDVLTRSVEQAYGRDRTFSAPILTMCVLAGRLGPSPRAWRHVAALPFELGVLGHGWLRRLRLPVVSYALPALIAIGQVRHRFRPPLCPVSRLLRNWARGATLRRLERIQPSDGGFLEAAPLTSFVAMSLAAIGQETHPVARRAAGWLLSSQREDGAWPIDTNLATWLTTLSINALSAAGPVETWLGEAACGRLRDWLLSQQHRQEHPYTGAPPGGWAWTDLPGGVPDADDTAGALLALRNLGEPYGPAVEMGTTWLLGLQNRDGGIPTFCRGWGRLPFDRSAADLTAHAVAAWAAWRDRLGEGLRARVDRSAAGAVRFLAREQAAEGWWAPLWFGNEHSPGCQNRVYGTARVLEGLAPWPAGTPDGMLRRAAEWLASASSADGGWGGDGASSSVEETALVTGALAAFLRGTGASPAAAPGAIRSAMDKGCAWLAREAQEGFRAPAAPIGLYFARLWYCEELYPAIFPTAAMGSVQRLLEARGR